jgi:hypothetical protein
MIPIKAAVRHGVIDIGNQDRHAAFLQLDFVFHGDSVDICDEPDLD